MGRWLPEIGPNGVYAKSPSRTLDEWILGVKEIATRHGLSATNISRYDGGQNPVFEVSEGVVLKLLPRSVAHLAVREARCLEWLSRRSAIPSPTLLGTGQLEDWSYLLTTKLLGTPLSVRWAGLSGIDRDAIAAELGRLLRKLHEIPIGDFSPGNMLWESFLAQGAGKWLGRASVGRLSSRLRETGPDYIVRALKGQTALNRVFLHGDLAPENCLVSDVDGTWRISGIFDFGNAMVGDSVFDFTALTVLLAPGNAAILRQVFLGYGLPRTSVADQQALLMAYTLLHPLGDISEILGFLPGLSQSDSWDQIAKRFWPAAGFP